MGEEVEKEPQDASPAKGRRWNFILTMVERRKAFQRKDMT